MSALRLKTFFLYFFYPLQNSFPSCQQNHKNLSLYQYFIVIADPQKRIYSTDMSFSHIRQVLLVSQNSYHFSLVYILIVLKE